MNAKRSSDSSPVEVRTDAADLDWAQERGPRGDGSVEDALHELLEVADLVRPALAKRLDMGINDLRAMEHLVREPLGPVELAHRLEMTSAAATVLLDRLEHAGHVRREAHPSDARRRIVQVTGHGLASALREIRPMVEELDAAAIGLSAAERDVVRRYLAAVTDALRRTIDPP